MHTYEVRPREEYRGVNLINDMLPFGRLLYLEVRHDEWRHADIKNYFAGFLVISRHPLRRNGVDEG